MTIRTTTNHLRHAHSTLEVILRDIGTWHRWIASLMPDGYPAGNSNTGHSNNISDPTATTAIARTRDRHLLTDAEDIARRIHELTDDLYRTVNAGPARIDTASVAKAARCSGAVDPTCTRLADGRRHKTGLCDACWMQQYREQRQAS